MSAEPKTVRKGDYQPGSAVDMVLSLLTALERSAPADPGHGEIQFRNEVVAKAETWLRSVRQDNTSSVATS